MSKHLVVVESPAKAKTIRRYLGGDYRVEASVGHVRDLPRKELGVDLQQDFAPVYRTMQGKAKVVQAIREAAAGSDRIYLATDPDREGEAIAWHVSIAAGLDPERTRRIAFYEVTKAAVQAALAQPRALDHDLIDAQQARRVLDRLVGYQISPLLSKTMRRALSAGRVQSIALRLVVEREREILAFVPEEYWSLEADLQRRIEGREQFRARLLKIAGEDPQLQAKPEVDRILAILQEATYEITDVSKGQRQQAPRPPFVTSTLQSTASARLHFTPRQTMRLAQQLYEGIDLEGERVGLITYMRTDSPHVAPEAQAEARQFIAERWGADYLPEEPPEYKARASRAQEAHEAIRPTSVLRTPEAMQVHLDARQARLYDLIWRRFVASQMKPALYATMSVDILAARDYLFRATGRKLLFPGHLAAYAEDEDDLTSRDQELPPLTVGEIVDLLELIPEQHFTQPPPRYSEATLIKALEENGVGRPSTYASIVTVIQDRSYVEKEKGRLKPTALGMVVCDTLIASFTDIMQVGYTAQMEERLDLIASGELSYADMLHAFYAAFEAELAAAGGSMGDAYRSALWADVPEELKATTCPRCGRTMEMRLSKAGRFLGCSGYPGCRYILDLTDPSEPQKPEEPTFAEGELCEQCGGRMKIITYRGDQFLGCENYPKCKHTRPILSESIKQLALNTACPQCGRQPLEPRKGRYGEYLHCPECQTNHSLRKLGLSVQAEAAKAEESAAESAQESHACPECGHEPLERRSGRYGPYYRCPACAKNFSEKKLAALSGRDG
ncbi:MAG: type I DNA topoisomerase [Anaerolineae bacterium]|nr:type I DNA topoisomerase [Anaerolineae bacterium]